MFDQTEITRAVDMQQRSYRMLRWIASAVKRGFVDFTVAHKYATFPEAAQKWLIKHYQNIPDDARPAKEDIEVFTDFFGTYLENSFDLVSRPRRILYSPDAHCFCPMCSWMIESPNLKAKKVTSGDKKRAERLKVDAGVRIAMGIQVGMDRTRIETLLKGDENGVNAALVAYGHDLLSRMKGVATGPAVLALWRSFAWTKKGSPKPDFELSASGIMSAERQLAEAIRLETR